MQHYPIQKNNRDTNYRHTTAHKQQYKNTNYQEHTSRKSRI